MVDHDFSFEYYLATWKAKFGEALEAEEVYYIGDEVRTVDIVRLTEDQFREAVDTLAEIDARFARLLHLAEKGEMSNLDKDQRISLLYDEALKIEIMLLV